MTVDGNADPSSQHFHTKAALMICAARTNLPPSLTKAGEIRQDRWVSLSFSFFALKRARQECSLCSLLFISSDVGARIKILVTVRLFG